MNQSNAGQGIGAVNADRLLVLYHSGCADGQGAAAAFYSKYKDAEFYPATYGRPVPDVTGRVVYILDFSYPRAVIIEMCKTAKSVTILDHHKSAKLDLQGLELPNLIQQFDMGRSGAVIAWQYCWPTRRVPVLLQHIQDRDLWKFNLPNTKAVSAYLYGKEFDIAEWDSLLSDSYLKMYLNDILSQGGALLRQDEKRLKEIVKQARPMNIEGHIVPAVNCNHYFASDVGGLLSEGQEFAACYYDNAYGRRVFSLRAKRNGTDVSLIAEKFGGGGHSGAAGFNVSLGKARSYEKPRWWQLISGLRWLYARRKAKQFRI